jgi:hypothetical protein
MIGRRRRIARLEQRLIDAEHSWLHGHGLASLLAWDRAHPQSDDDDIDYTDSASESGLRGLLSYHPQRIERSDDSID